MAWCDLPPRPAALLVTAFPKIVGRPGCEIVRPAHPTFHGSSNIGKAGHSAHSHVSASKRRMWSLALPQCVPCLLVVMPAWLTVCTAFHFPISARAWGALPPRAELGRELRACLTSHPVTQRSWSGGLAKVVSDTPVSLPGGSGWCTDMRRLPTTTTTTGTGSSKLCWPQIGSDCTVSITPALRMVAALLKRRRSCRNSASVQLADLSL